MTWLGKIKSCFSSRNKNTSLVAGLLFFTGWWILIDAMARDGQHQITAGHVIIGIFGTISFCMINTVKGRHVSENNLAKIWLLIGFVIGFASITAALWVMVDDFIINDKKDASYGVSLLLQNFFILIGSVVYKFGRNEENWNE